MSRTLRVFEHDRIKVGEGGLRPQELDALLRFNDEHAAGYFEAGYKHLRTKSYVGYVEVGDVAIEILPKADRHSVNDAHPWREGLLEMLKVAGGLDLERLPNASQKLSRRSLIEIIAQAYLAELEPLLREGLARGYRTIESNGTVFRGRLKVVEHIRANLVRADRFYVAYQSFDHHIAINRVLLAGLDVLSWLALSNSTGCAVEAAMARFPELSVAGVDATALHRLHLNRATQRYAGALTYARMILAHQGPQLRAGRERVFALLFDMNALWERYIAVLMRKVAPPGCHVHAQEQHAFWLPQQRNVRKVKPDIVVRDEGGDSLLVIDTKWKVPSNGQPSDDDLKQMFVYNELLGCSRSILLYPRTGSSSAAHGSFATGGHGCAQDHVGVIEGAHWSTPAVMEQLREMLVTALTRSVTRIEMPSRG
jgi:5-methylcytosine-specific restriction enzyme subunit McrC